MESRETVVDRIPLVLSKEQEDTLKEVLALKQYVYGELKHHDVPEDNTKDHFLIDIVRFQYRLRQRFIEEAEKSGSPKPVSEDDFYLWHQIIGSTIELDQVSYFDTEDKAIESFMRKEADKMKIAENVRNGKKGEPQN